MSRPVWTPEPEQAAESAMARFAARVAALESAPALADPLALHAFSVEHGARFWRYLVEFLAIPFSGELEPALEGSDVETARFFVGLRLSYPEILLRSLAPTDGDWPAIIGLDEEGVAARLTRDEVRDRVGRLTSALQALGVGPGDRVAAVVRNRAETVVAALAVVACGATWSSVAPEMGAGATLDRLRQLRPTWLMGHTRWREQGRERSLEPLLTQLVGTLDARGIVLLDDGEVSLDLPIHRADALMAGSAGRADWVRRPFDHPLFILFSSGTTGPPKCIVHGHGGTAVEHLKELVLHTDVRQGDRLYYTTSTAWMMWNWLISGLGAGAAIVLHDGSVAWPEKDALLTRLAAVEPTHFGTSPAYLRYLVDAAVEVPPLPGLRAVMSTGSILYDGQYEAAMTRFGDIPVQSISGGTDIVGCFVLGSPVRPVYVGESQAISLGYDVRVALPDGAIARQGTGELVCAAPFPSRPVGLLNDPDGSRFHQTWFAATPGVWSHGDFLELTERGTARINGRSDGVLNIRGIRMGPAEIYRALQSVPEVVATLAIDQPWPRAIGGRRLVLLVVLQEGLSLDRALMRRMKKTIRDAASRNHVPDVVAQVAELPTTHSGKRSERAASDLLSGRPVRNLAALRNPASLEALRGIESLWPRG